MRSGKKKGEDVDLSIETLELCSSKCLQQGITAEASLIQKSCFNRCVVKFAEAVKFTNEHVKYQNHEIKKTNDQLRLEKEGIENKGFMEKMYAIYNEHYGIPQSTEG